MPVGICAAKLVTLASPWNLASFSDDSHLHLLCCAMSRRGIRRFVSVNATLYTATIVRHVAAPLFSSWITSVHRCDTLGIYLMPDTLLRLGKKQTSNREFTLCLAK